MTAITVQITDDQAVRLKAEAKRLGISVEQFAAAALEDLLSRPPEDFQRAADRIVTEYKELYQRLA